MLEQNADRYSLGDGEVRISASPRVEPLRIRISNVELEFIPELAAEGVIISVGDRFLIGPKTYSMIRTAGADPHYTYKENGPIEYKPGSFVVLGRTIPIIRLDLTGLEARADAQAFSLRRAGVAEVDWNWDDAGPVPEGVLRQINWTVGADAPRPGDRYTLSDLGLSADYSYETLRIARPAEGGRIDPDAIGEIIRRVNRRVNDLRSDFNSLQSVYFDGVLPTGRLAPVDVVYGDDSSTPPDDPADGAGRQRLRRNTVVVGVDTGPTDRANGDNLVDPTTLGEITALSATPPPPVEPDPAPASPVEARRSTTPVLQAIGGVLTASPIIRLLGRLFRRRGR